MAPTIEQIMLGIEARLDTIDGLRVADYVPEQVNPPQAFVGVPPIPEYRTTFGRGVFTIAPTVTLLVSKAWARTGQRKLAAFAAVTGAQSIPAAIEADRTLGGIVDETVVDSFEPLGVELVGVIGYYGGVFNLRVIARGV